MHSPLEIHIAFLLFVALSVFAQTLTGFAQSLILLGLIGATGIVPLPDAINAATVLSCINAWTYAYLRRPVRIEPVLWPSIWASAAGVFLGTFLLTWLVGTAYEVLRLLLGISVVVCAGLLWSVAKPLPRLSSPAAFAGFGGVAGIMGGLFSTSGPPLVYLLYRQPLAQARIQESLLLIFGFTSLLRLLIVVPSGHFSMFSLQLALEALPIAVLVTFLTVRHPPALPARLLKAIVCVLLVATGLAMVVGSLRTSF
jgi:hypothetical protein